MAGNRKNNTAMVTALILGVHCCLPGMAVKAEEKPDDAAGVQTDSGSVEQIHSEKGNGLLGNLEFGDFPKDILGNQELLLKYQDTFGVNTHAVDQGIPGASESSELVTDPEEESDSRELAADPEEESDGSGKELPDSSSKDLSDNADVLEKESLQMPQKLEVVIDPWEMDGKGQIYSEKYQIRNTGEDTGRLTLSGLTCKPREKSGAIVRTDRNGIHEDKRKSIYMEMVFSTGERIVLSEEGAGYEAELRPGEEVSLEFSGEVNEYASGSWDNEDIIVGVVYSWDMEEDTADISGDAAESEEETGKDDKSGDVSGDVSEDKSGDVSGDASEDKAGDVSGDSSKDCSGDVSGDVLKNRSGDVSGDALKDSSGDVQGDRWEDQATNGLGEMETSRDKTIGDFSEGSSETGKGELSGNHQTEDIEHWKEEIRTVELDRSEEAELEVDSWTATVDGESASVWYALRNTGKTTGMLTLSEPVWIGAGQDEFTVRMIPGSEENLQESEKPEFFAYIEQREKCVLIDLIPEDGEHRVQQAGSEENRKISEYQVELKPGEEMMVCVSVRLDGMTLEELEGGKTAVKARYSWAMGEEVSGE